VADPEVSHPTVRELAQFDDHIFNALPTIAAGDFLHSQFAPFQGLFSPFHFSLPADFEPEELALGERRALALGAASVLRQ
jgi:hypothetical protein